MIEYTKIPPCLSFIAYFLILKCHDLIRILKRDIFSLFSDLLLLMSMSNGTDLCAIINSIQMRSKCAAKSKDDDMILRRLKKLPSPIIPIFVNKVFAGEEDHTYFNLPFNY